MQPDQDTYSYEDAYRMPGCPGLARMRAIDVMTAEKGIEVDWPRIDFITDRDTLRKLFRWTSGTRACKFASTWSLRASAPCF